jgi:hypothetical protein
MITLPINIVLWNLNTIQIQYNMAKNILYSYLDSLREVVVERWWWRGGGGGHSDGHGFTHPHGIAGTGVTGTGAESKYLTRTEPAPVMRVYGFNCRFLLGMGGMVPNLIQLYSLFLTQLRHLKKKNFVHQ